MDATQPLAKRDMARQNFNKSRSFSDKKERDQYLVEEAKAHIVRELHALEGRIGREAAKDFVRKEWLDLAF